MNFDINLILIPLLFVSGTILLLNRLLKNKNKQPDLSDGETGLTAAQTAVKGATANKIPWWLDYSRSLFPIILIVVIIRSFVAEPYQIPSSSMVPTLIKGDFILVNKYKYGLRLPLSNQEIVPFKRPQRGDIIVFSFPFDPKVRYIKRVVGLPGDRILYINKTLIVNGEEVEESSFHRGEDYEDFIEVLGDKPHLVRKLGFVPYESLAQTSWQVPPEHYFAMGDSRDNSNDSRYWGFIPHDKLVGEAFFIWMNWQSTLPNFKRAGFID